MVFGYISSSDYYVTRLQYPEVYAFDYSDPSPSPIQRLYCINAETQYIASEIIGPEIALIKNNRHKTKPAKKT